MTADESRAYSSIAARIARNASQAVSDSLRTDFGLLLLLEKNNKSLARAIQREIEHAMRRAVEAVNTGVRREIDRGLRPSLATPPQASLVQELVAFCSDRMRIDEIRRFVRTRVRASDARIDVLIRELVRSRMLVHDVESGTYHGIPHRRPVRVV